MAESREFLQQIIKENYLIYGILSNRKKKLGNLDREIKKVKFKPVMIKNQILIQIELYTEKQVFHNNVSINEALDKLDEIFKAGFKQANIFTVENDLQVFINKDLTIKVLKAEPTKKIQNIQHNREKKYILDSKECGFLTRLGITNKSGKILDKKYDKFKQLNRFLELVDDCLKANMPDDKEFVIIDFGCGKSYLTFALYYYLVEIKNINAKIIGLDLKEDVIKLCNNIARDLNFDKLEFTHGDIKDYKGIDKVDMVITLHACDTATDDALIKAIEWDAKIIMSVPCCQHELFSKIHNPTMKSMEKHGIIKERMASLITDSLRANVLEILGYSTQIVEFINMEHTPKNLMIRAVKSNKTNKEEALQDYKNLTSFWNIKPYIEEQLKEKSIEL